MSERPRLLARYPALQYALLSALGCFGVYVARPIFFTPQSRLDWIDLTLNWIIFVPAALIALSCGVIALMLGGLSINPDKKGTVARVSTAVLGAAGLQRLAMGELNPVALFRQLFLGDSGGDNGQGYKSG